jgi:hypothetical protein
MKTSSLLISLCIALILLTSAGMGAAQYEPLAQAKDLSFSRNFLSYIKEYGSQPWWQSHTLVDAAGGVHTAYYTGQSIYYAYCAADCGKAPSWKKTALAPSGDYDSLSYPTLGLDPNGRPRMVLYRYPNYVYLECNANCSTASSWKSVEVRLNPDNYNNYPRDARYFALDAQGRPRFISYYYNGLTYATCNATCTTQSNWQYNELNFGSGYSLFGAQLAFNASGQPRVIGVSGEDLIYAQCDQNCHVSQNWSRLKIAGGVGNISNLPTYSLRLDAQGRPRVAFYKAANSDKNMYYAWANANYASPASWTIDSLPLPPATDRTLDMAIDSQGNQHIVYADENFDLSYIRCTSNCDTLQSEWYLQSVETGADLDDSDYLPPDDGFWGSGWWVDGYPSLALDKNDSPRISYYVRNVQYYNTSPYNKVWAVRFAGATASMYKYSVFVPMLRK